MIIKSDYRIASLTDGYGLLLRNKHVNDAEHRSPKNSVLFVHGATYGSTSTFDYAISGESWMDSMAAAGFDVWCLDLLGYGLSDRPDEMNEPAEANPPLVDTRHAVQEVNRAVDFILRDRGVEQVSLIGYSWGSAICGCYAGEFPDKVRRLVLSGALWVEKAVKPTSVPLTTGAYRTVDAASMVKRWGIGLTDEAFAQIVPLSLVKQWSADAVASDPNGEASGVLRAPTGVVKDFMHCSQTGEPWYDPGKINAPTQIVVGEFDRETTPEQGRQIFELLNPEIDRRFTLIGGGTHSLLLENHRHALDSVVSGFLR